MSQHSLRVAEEATKDKELLGTTNQHDADRQVEAIKEQLEEVKETHDEAAETQTEEMKGKRDKKAQKEARNAKATEKENQ